MKVWILFIMSWNSFEGEYNEKAIFKIYSSEEKANTMKTKLEKEEQDNYNNLSKFEKEEWEEYGYQMNRYFVQEYPVE